jgi:hypothetical protein
MAMKYRVNVTRGFGDPRFDPPNSGPRQLRRAVSVRNIIAFWLQIRSSGAPVNSLNLPPSCFRVKSSRNF